MDAAYQNCQSIPISIEIIKIFTIPAIKQISSIKDIKILPFEHNFVGIQRNLNPERALSRSERKWAETTFVIPKMARKYSHAVRSANQNSAIGHVIGDTCSAAINFVVNSVSSEF